MHKGDDLSIHLSEHGGASVVQKLLQGLAVWSAMSEVDQKPKDYVNVYVLARKVVFGKADKQGVILFHGFDATLSHFHTHCKTIAVHWDGQYDLTGHV